MNPEHLPAHPKSRKKSREKGLVMELTDVEEQRVRDFFALRTTEPDQKGCVIWTGTRTVTGYGLCGLHVEGKRTAIMAHRVAWYLSFSEWPPPWPTSGMVVDHICRNKLCVNVDHLRIITHEENMARPKAKHSKTVRHCKCCPNHPSNQGE